MLHSGEAVTLNYGPSPALMKQIENGPDQDIFSACNPAIGTVADVAEARSKSSTARSTQPTPTRETEEM
jgi:ABC-type molybdate transport system substrate-binding protein